MSLPIKSRIARAALLVAAAAPVIGMGASSASAADLPASGLGGQLTSPDTANGAANALNGTAEKANGVVNATGRSALTKGLPAAQHVVGEMEKAAVPAAQQVVSDASHSLTHSAAKGTRSIGGHGPADKLPVHGLTDNLSHVGVDQLPTRALGLS